MAKEAKTNAMRILDKNKISYQTISYECEEFIDGIAVAEKTGTDIEKSFKTLVILGKSGEYCVLVLPVANEADLKVTAKVLNEKSVEMIPVKNINKVTGYIRGGCSPLGMKKSYRTIIHKSAENYLDIYISGGRLGSTIRVNPKDLAKVTNAVFADIIESLI